MTPWYEIYRERMNAQYRDHVAIKYGPFLQALHSTSGRVITEVGCGAGNITRILREMREIETWYHLTDSCPKMLGLAVENNPVHNCNFSVSDVRRSIPAESDLIHSHGLLEHFEDLDIIRIVNHMAVAAPVQLHYVPGAKYEVPSRGDERLMEPDEWKYILRRFGHKVSISTFNNEFDIILRIER